MKPIASIICAVAALSLSGLAHAIPGQPTTYSATLELTGFPSLSPTSSIGDWVGDSRSSASVSASHIDWMMVPPRGALTRSWTSPRSSSNTSAFDFGTPAVGAPQSAVAMTAVDQVTATATNTGLKMSSTVAFGEAQGIGGAGDARTQWSRDFVLKPGATMTFSALADIDATDRYGQPKAWSPYETYGSSKTIGLLSHMTDFTNTGLTGVQFDSRSLLWVSFQGPFTQDLAGVVDHSVNNQTGELSFTIFNKFNTALSGSLTADTWMYAMQNTPAVPEPHTYASMLLGFGVMCAVARRKRKAADRA
jgi:hypothetical protein